MWNFSGKAPVSQVVLIPKLVEKIARQTPPSSSLVYQNIRQKAKLRDREENNFEFEFKNDNFPDTDSVVKEAKIFDESTAEPDAAVEASGKEVDELELDEGNKSIWND